MSTQECWLFLNCEALTGKPVDECPNYNTCKEAGQDSPHRKCVLPYTYEQESYYHGLKVLWVRRCELPQEAYEAGWHTAKYIPYVRGEYQINSNEFIPILTVEIIKNGLTEGEQKEIHRSGWQKAESIPYHWSEPWQEKRYLAVKKYPLGFPEKFIEAGWHPAINFPYHCFMVTWETPNYFHLEVNFNAENPAYAELTSLGWYPPVNLPEIY